MAGAIAVCVVEFDLPYFIAVPDGIVDGVDHPGPDAIAKLAPPYLVKARGGLVELRFLRRVTANRSILVYQELGGDRTGRSAHSTVSAIVPGILLPTWEEAAGKVDVANPSEVAVAIAVEAINHFARHYRIIAKRPYITPVTVPIVQWFFLRFLYADGTEHTMTFGRGGGWAASNPPFMPPEFDDSVLRTAISSDGQPQLQAVLAINFEDHRDAEDWRLALLELAIFTEVWLSDWIREKYRAKGLDETAIDAKFKDKKGKPIAIRTAARTLVLEATGFDFEHTAEFTAWDEKVREPRNDLAHGSRIVVSPTEVADALQAVCAMQKLLLSK